MTAKSSTERLSAASRSLPSTGDSRVRYGRPRSVNSRAWCKAGERSTASTPGRTRLIAMTRRFGEHGRRPRYPHVADGAAAQGGRSARRRQGIPPGGAAVLRQADRAVAEFRGAGGHRDGERAADHRDARGVGAADRDRRGVAGHQFLARRPRAGVRRDAGKGARALRRPPTAPWSCTTASSSAPWRRVGCRTRFARLLRQGVPRRRTSGRSARCSMASGSSTSPI